MSVIMKVTRISADLITYHLPVTLRVSTYVFVFAGCHLCGYQALNSVLSLPLPPQSSGSFLLNAEAPGALWCSDSITLSLRVVRQKLMELINAATQHPFDCLLSLWVGVAHNPQVCPQKQPFMWMSCENSRVPPQKRPYMWISCRKTKVPPQKQPYMWISCRKTKVPPQKQPYMWID